MALTDINAAVVGTGFIGVAHVEALRRLGVNVVGVMGSSPERAREKARAANLPDVYHDLDALLSDDRVDVVHVASPNHVHFDQAMAALEAGKHVVCEKPLGLDSNETSRLVAKAEETGLVNAVCFNIRFYPLVHQMAAMVAAGEIGAPRLVHGSYLQDWLLLETDWNWRLEADKAGQRPAVVGIGTDWMNMVLVMTGKQVDEVMSELHTYVTTRRHPEGSVETFTAVYEDVLLVEEEMGSDDAASIMLRFEDGARGLLAVSQVSAGHKNRLTLEVDGSESAVMWVSEDPDRLWIGHRGRPNEVMARDPGAMAEPATRIAAYPGGHGEGYPATFRGRFSRVYADVEAGRPSPEIGRASGR